MILDTLFDSKFAAVQKALDLTWKRNEAIASNIANAETPQYRAVDIDFGTELQKAYGSTEQTLIQTNSQHLDISSDSIAHRVADYSGMTKQDGNNVDIDIQMGKLSYNAGKYTQAANLIRKHFQLLTNAIRQVG